MVGLFDSTVQEEIDSFIGDSCQTLRDYGRGRTVMSVIVAVFISVVAFLLSLPLVLTIFVVNFIGGYIPYIGAFLGGGLAVVIALGEGGVQTAAIMLVAVVASNLLLENFVEPKVMGRTLNIHPLVVLVVTALGGIVGGIVGLILAVPAWVLATDAIRRLRRRGFFRPRCRPRRTDGATHTPMTRRDTDPSTGETEQSSTENRLSTKRRWLLISLGLIRGAVTAAIMVALYYVLPLDQGSQSAIFIAFAVGMLLLLGTLAWQVRAIVRATYPALRAPQALATTVPLFLLVFAATYFTLSFNDPNTFSEPLSRSGALYFAITVFSTVGFGDITPETDAVRLFVAAQMLLDLVVLGVGIKVILAAVQRGRES